MSDPAILPFIFSLLGGFAALLWLKPGKHEAIRYALITLTFGGLCYILNSKAVEDIPNFITYIEWAIPLLLFLLGAKMLACPWRRAVLSLGVYALVAWLDRFFAIFQYDFSGSHLLVELLAPFQAYIEVLWLLLFIYWCTRKDSNIRPSERLFAAAAFTLIYGYITLLYRYVTYLFSAELNLPGINLLLSAAIYLICLGGFLRYVLNQPWKRSLRITAIVVLISTGITYTGQCMILSAMRQKNLSEQLIDCIENNDLPGVQNCLQQGVDINKPHRGLNQNGEYTDFHPLISAIYFGDNKLVEVILAAGANVHIRLENGDTPLHIACCNEDDNTQLVKLLLTYGADATRKNNAGETALDCAEMCDNTGVAELLKQCHSSAETSD